MTEPRTLDFEITNVEGVAQATLHLTPGVNVLRGRNAAGKTSALRAVTRASGGATTLERRDGSEHGTVSGPGVMLRVGKTVRTTGETELELADVGPLAKLIDPGLKDSEAAARERLRALAEMLRLPLDDDAARTLAQGSEALYDWIFRAYIEDRIGDDLLEAAEQLKRRAQADAREAEAKAAQAKAKAQAAAADASRLLEEIGPGRLLEEDPEQIRQELDRATREHERAVAQCEAREELERRQEEIRASLGIRPNAAAQLRLVPQRQAERAEAERRVNELKEELQRAQQEAVSAQHRLDAATRELDRVNEQAERWDERQSVLDEPLSGPTREEVERLKRDTVDVAAERLRRAEKTAEYSRADVARSSFTNDMTAFEKAALELRRIASGIPQALGMILRESGAQGLTVIDGRLHALQENGSPLDFETRLSDGQRVRYALDVAAQAFGDRVVPLDGRYWQALDPENRRQFVELARERGLYVLTEEPAEGELRVEHEG